MAFDPAFAGEQQRVWNRIAPYWSQRTKEIDVVAPLCVVRPGDVVLDIGCGAGNAARAAARAGATVVAVDASPVFVDIARGRSDGLPIDWRVADALDVDALLALGEGRFDLVVAKMVLMNLVDLEPVMTAVTRILKPSGAFVFTVTHPCFPAVSQPTASVGAKGSRERLFGVAIRVQKLTPAFVTRLYVRLARGYAAARGDVPYLRPRSLRIGDAGQPEPHVNFHRPLQDLLAPAFRAGLVVDGLHETPDDWFPSQAALLAVRLRRQ